VTRRRLEQTAGVWLPLLLTALVLGLDVAEGRRPQFIGVLAAMPLVAAALATPWVTAAVSAAVLAAAFAAGFVMHDDAGEAVAVTAPQLVRLGFILAAGLLAVGIAVTRRRLDRRMARLAGVADAAQKAILRPLPPSLGDVTCATIYLSATSEASVGGDLIEVLDTSHGIRAVVGDVRGSGLDAVRLAGLVLGAFRELAWSEPDVATVVVGLDRAVRRDTGPEDFVTVLVVELDPAGRLTIVTCGHPGPYVVNPDRTDALELTTLPSPPLGLLSEPPDATYATLAPGDRLVLVTDGLLEARRPRRRWPGRQRTSDGPRFLAAERLLADRLARGPLEAGLAGLVADVHRWTRGEIRDDLAVLVLEPRTSAAVGDGPAAPARHP
jgi:phosphoserine phosphatase RsbU/P